MKKYLYLVIGAFLAIPIAGAISVVNAQSYSHGFTYETPGGCVENCTFTGTTNLTTLNVSGTATIGTLSVTTAESVVGKTNLISTSNTTSTASIINWGTGGSANFIGQALFSDGTVSLPGVSFTSDTNTGLYRIGADQLGLTVGGSAVFKASTTEVVFPLTGTKLGLGTTTPSAKLSVSTPAQQAPAYKMLDIASTTGRTLLGLSADGILSMGAGSGAPINVFQVNTASSTVDVLSGLNIGGIQSPTNPGQYVFHNTPVDSSSVDETVHGGSISLDSNPLITWLGYSDGAGSVDKLRVGIGTTSPAVLLHVESPVAGATTTVRFGRTNTGKGTCMQLFDTAGTALRAYIRAGTTAFTLEAGTCQ